MSIPINKINENCYYLLMDNNVIPEWFINKYLDWQRDNKEINSMAEFARFLGVGEKALNTWFNGRNNPSFQKALQVCDRLNDYSLLELLGYKRPESVEEQVKSLSYEIKSTFELAVREILVTFNEREITSDINVAESIAEEILKKYGFKFNSN